MDRYLRTRIESITERDFWSSIRPIAGVKPALAAARAGQRGRAYRLLGDFHATSLRCEADDCVETMQECKDNKKATADVKRLADMAHVHGVKVMFHSCGAIVPLIDRIIGLGVDVLDPIQVAADGMVPEAIKERFGSRICLHGAVDVQGWLQRSRPEEIRREVHRLMEARRWKFALCGSSARKLRRGGVNLLGGRAVTRHLGAFSSAELGSGYDPEVAAEWGCLPAVQLDPKAAVIDGRIAAGKMAPALAA